MLDKIKRNIQYILREDLNISQRLAATVILMIVPAQLLALILAVVLNKGMLVVTLQIALLAVTVAVLYALNKSPDSKIPNIILVVLTNYIILPTLYFFSGGHESGVILWMIIGCICTWFLCEGKLRYFLIIVNYLVVLSCVMLEKMYPQILIYLDSDYYVGIDTIVAFVILTFLIGSSISKAVKDDEEKTEVLKNKEALLMETNAKLEEFNVNLEQLSQIKSNFLSNMSHEIRTPINGIIGMNEMIKRKTDDEEIKEYANDVQVSANHLLAILNDILEYSKIVQGNIELYPVEYSVKSLIQDCFYMVVEKAKKKDLKLYVENDVDIPVMLYGDELRVRGIIKNLLMNAVKYTKDGYVKLSVNYKLVNAENIELIIEVKDTGIGIEEDKLETIFNAFDGLDESANRSSDGTGLGLALTKIILNKMEGDLTAKSVVGEGSAFTAVIPQRIANHGDFIGDLSKELIYEPELNKNGTVIDRAKARGIRGTTADSFKVGNETINGASKLAGPDKEDVAASFVAPDARILVVDDVKMNRNVARLLLKGTKIEVDLAESGEECLKYTMMKHYDLILMDHMMPEMDGMETFRKVKSQAYGLNNSTPVIVMTANAVSGAEQMYEEEGFKTYISKPVKAEVLEEKLKEYLPKEKVIVSNPD